MTTFGDLQVGDEFIESDGTKDWHFRVTRKGKDPNYGDRVWLITVDPPGMASDNFSMDAFQRLGEGIRIIPREVVIEEDPL